MNPYTSLAKSAVENYIKTGKIIPAFGDIPDNKAGVFVIIQNDNDCGKRLRGCIGTFSPTKKNIAQEIIANAIAAATEDYRFTPIRENELDELYYTVSVLDKPEPLNIKNPIKESEEGLQKAGLDAKKYGIIVKNAPSSKTGLLLPDLEGVNSIKEQIYIACEKADINPSEQKILIHRFSAKKYG